MTVPKPQETGCTTIEVEPGNQEYNEGVTNGILDLISNYRHIEYIEERGVYVVRGDAKGWSRDL
jgi:hypothetical protein